MIQLDAVVHTYFNKFLKCGVFVAILLVAIGGIMFLVHNGMREYHIETTLAKLDLHGAWVGFIKSGIFLLIVLQITRILFCGIIFLLSKELALALMSLFITLVLAVSLVIAA